MLWATDANGYPEAIFTEREGLELTYSPRKVSGRADWILIGGKPHSLIATRLDGDWVVVRDDLPSWVTSAAVSQDQLNIIGNQRGIFFAEQLQLP